MDTNIKAIHFDITDKLTAFVEKKVDRIIRRFPNVISVDVSLRLIKPETAMNKNAIIVMAVPDRDDLVGDKTADTFEEAVGLSLEAIEKQLEKIKGKNR